MMTVYLPFVMSCFLSKLKRSINDITISVAQANSRVFTDWLKRLILMSKEESSRSKRSYQLRVIHRRGYRSHTSISQRSLGPVTLAVDPSNFPRACRQKIHNEDQESLVFVDKPAINDSVKSVFFPQEMVFVSSV